MSSCTECMGQPDCPYLCQVCDRHHPVLSMVRDCLERATEPTRRDIRIAG